MMIDGENIESSPVQNDGVAPEAMPPVAGDEVTVITETGEQTGVVNVVWQDGTDAPPIDVIVDGVLLYSVQHESVAASRPAWRAISA